MNHNESQLHRLGKEVFVDAEGKMITLPRPPSPRLTPPGTFKIKRVQLEYPLPVGREGRRPDVVLTDEHGVRLIVEVKNTSAKGRKYGNDMYESGFSLILELDVSRWRNEKELRPDFSSRGMLQHVVDQCVWFSAGKPRTVAWAEVTLGYSIYTQESTDRSWKELNEQGITKDNGKWEHYRKLGEQKADMKCHILWREATPLTDYLIIEQGDGTFQPADFTIQPYFFPFYQHELIYRATAMHNYVDACPSSSCKMMKPLYGSCLHREGDIAWKWKGEIHTEWKTAVNEMFARVAPGAQPIYTKGTLS